MYGHNQQERCIRLEGETSEQKNSLLWHVKNVQGDTYFVPVDITDEAIELVARKLSGSSGPVGKDSGALQGWILKF